jgi:RNA polymerase sigma-70 factor (family 1)
MIEENELVQLTSKGDKAAFTKLFERHHLRLGTFIYKITKSKEIAEEVVLDIFLKIWMTRETLAEIRNFDAYLFVLAKNGALMALRKASREHAKIDEWKKDSVTDIGGAENDNKEFYLTLIDEAINHLSPQRKKIYLLSRHKGLTYAEIGKELHLSKLTVRAHIQQAIAAISNYVLSRTGSRVSALFILIHFL